MVQAPTRRAEPRNPLSDINKESTGQVGNPKTKRRKRSTDYTDFTDGKNQEM
jgi:hypothetical protein